MSVKTITDAVLRSLAENGIKERTIAHQYSCFYRALCIKSGEKELDEALVSSFLVEKYGRDILQTPNCQLKWHEQTCKHAFHTLMDYHASERLQVRCRCPRNLQPGEDELLDNYISFCTEAGNRPRTLQRKRDTVKRFLFINSLRSIAPSGIQAYIQQPVWQCPD